MNPIALNDRDARHYVGCSEQVWRKLKVGGIVKPHPLTRSYTVRDLDLLIYGDTGENRQILSETANAGRTEAGSKSSHGRRSRGAGRVEAKGLLDTAVEATRQQSHAA